MQFRTVCLENVGFGYKAYMHIVLYKDGAFWDNSGQFVYGNAMENMRNEA